MPEAPDQPWGPMAAPRSVRVRRGDATPTVRVRRGDATPTATEHALALPGSKYLTLRTVLAALLAEGESRIHGPALSEDTAVLLRCVQALGGETSWERDAAGTWLLRLRGTGGRLRQPPGGVLRLGNAGAVLRLLLGLGALLPVVRYETDHPQSLGRRPNADLLHALEQLGLHVEATWPEGLLPITLRGGPPRGGVVRISGARSSQYLSALLLLGPLLAEGLEVHVTDALRSAPIAHLTLRVLRQAGIHLDAAEDLGVVRIPGGQRYQAREVWLPPDAPSAAALQAAALALGVPLRLPALDETDPGVHALAVAWSALLEQAGSAPRQIAGDGCIDSIPVLVAAACLLPGETRFTGVGTLRWKESDRIGDLCAELSRAGCAVRGLEDGIHIWGRPEGIAGGVTVDGHDDHRLVQALAIVALRSREGLVLTGADAIVKSYPGFFDDLQRLGAVVEQVSA